MNNVTVNVGRESTLNLKLETGEITATVDVTATVGGIDQQSTSTGQNLNDQLFQNVPVQRQVSSLFYLSPGATDSINPDAIIRQSPGAPHSITSTLQTA